MDEKEQPEFRWHRVPPAKELARLADQFGRPTVVRCTLRLEAVGQPTVVRCTLRLEAVGQDWDGTVKPIDELKYPPKAEGGE